MVGISPTDFGSILATDMGSLVKRAAFAYLFIGLADFAWQKQRTEKSMKMDKQEVRDEAKNAEPPGRGALDDPPAPDGGLAQAHDGRRPDRGRRRHQPDALLGRPALRHRPRPTRPRSWPRARASSPCASASSPREHGVPVIPDPPLARGLYASVEIGQLIPEEFFARRRRRPRLRLPHGGPEGCGMTNFFKRASQLLGPRRRRRRGAGRRDDDHPAAGVRAGPGDHAEHQRRAGHRRLDALHAAGDRLLLVPVAAAADHALPPGHQRLGHAPDPAARRRRATSSRPSAASSSAATSSSASSSS